MIVSVAHLDDEERTLALGVIFQELLRWVRTLGGSPHLQALVLFDEVYGFLPPHPANPLHDALRSNLTVSLPAAAQAVRIGARKAPHPTTTRLASDPIET